MNFSDLAHAELPPEVAQYRDNLVQQQKESGLTPDQFWSSLDQAQPELVSLMERVLFQKRVARWRMA